MPPVGFELRISAGEVPQTYALDRAATGLYRINESIDEASLWFADQNKLALRTVAYLHYVTSEARNDWVLHFILFRVQ